MLTAFAGADAVASELDELELAGEELDAADELGECELDVDVVEDAAELDESEVDDAVVEPEELVESLGAELDAALDDVAMVGSLVTGGVSREPRVIIQAAPNATIARTMTNTGANQDGRPERERAVGSSR